MRLIYLSNMPSINMSMNKRKRQGRGMGSVLLSRGGPGGASSYSSVEDYLETTNNRLGNGIFPMGAGMNTSGLKKRLESLSIAPKNNKTKNIRFNM